MKQIKIGDKLIDYKVIRTDRKTLGIIIDNDKNLTVRSPENTGDERIKDILQDKSLWILDKLSEVDKIKPAPKPKEFLSGEKLPYLGRRYRLKTTSSESAEKVQVSLYQGKFMIEYPKKLEKNEEERREAVRD